MFGVYYALQYLSLSDTTVLTFLTPFFTVLAGAALLGEQVRGGELVAGRLLLPRLSARDVRADQQGAVLSLGGVILIARPAFLFGGAGELENGVSPQQRLTAVGYACASSARYLT